MSTEPRPQGWLRRLGSLLHPHRGDVAMALGGAAVGQAVLALVPLIQRHVVDDVVLGGDGSILPGLLALLAASAVIFVASAIRRHRAGRVSLEVQHDLRTRLHDHLQRLDVGVHERLGVGQLVSRAISDVGLVQGLLAFLPLVLANGLFLVIALIAMLWLSPLLALVALAITPLMVLSSLRLRSSIHPATLDAQQRAGAVAGIVEQSVTGVRIVKGFGQEQQQVERLAGAARGLLASRVRVLRLTARHQPVLQSLPALAQAAVLALGGWLAIRGDISLGTFLAFSSYVGQLQAPARMIGNLVTVAQQARAGIERIFDLLDDGPTISSPPGAPPLRVDGGEIRFEGIRFRHGSGGPVLDGLDLEVRAGETMAIVGGSGSGKSTLAHLLPRLRDPEAGRISIDGTDIAAVELGSLRRSVGFVFEDPFLRSDSIAANIAYGRPGASQSEIEAAARVAGVHDVISAMPDGYGTVVGERGLTLSGGQRQRVALARAVLAAPAILVLDDATSAVDTRVEAEIHAALARVLAGRTTLLIAHRRSTLALADRIAVLEHGRVVDVGDHAELMVRCRIYRELLDGPDGGPGPSGARPLQDAPAEPPTTAFSGGDRTAGDLADPASTAAAVRERPPLPLLRDEPDIGVAEATDEGPRPFSFRRFISRWRLQLAVGLGLVVLDGLASLAGPLLIRRGLDSGVVPGRTGPLWAASALLAVVVIAGFFVMAAQIFLTGRVAERILYALRLKVFSHLQRLGLDHHDRESGGRTMTRMTGDIEALTQLLQNGLVQAIVAGLTGIGVGVVLFVMDFRLASLAFVAILPPLVMATSAFRRRSAAAYDEARDLIAAVNSDFQESLSDVRVVQVHGREELDAARFAARSRRHLDVRMRAQRLVSLYFPFVQFLSGAAGAIVIAAGAAMVRDGTLSPGALIAFLLYLDLFFGPVQQLSQVFDTYQQARVAIGRIGGLLDEETSVPVPADPVDPGEVEGHVELVGVGFSYPGTDRPVIEGLDLEIRAGETVAIVGETGAGKSTIEKLVARFYDVTEGRVLIDGRDVRDLDPAAFRRHLGIVPQEPYLFAGTIRDNIAYARPDASDRDVASAAEAVGAHDLIDSLDGGYAHEVTAGGRSLSAGERQLIALARALLPDPAILLLDEATANLDLTTEAKVSAAMRVAGRGRTTIVIAHRLSTAASADRIVVLDDGRIAEVGGHEELLAAGGPYAALWREADAVRLG